MTIPHQSLTSSCCQLLSLLQNPEDIPIPGGAVYVRQKYCKYLQGVPCPNHNHVRRYMIPKNAYSLATYSLAELNRAQAAKAGAGAAALTARAPGAAPRATTAPTLPAAPRTQTGWVPAQPAWG